MNDQRGWETPVLFSNTEVKPVSVPELYCTSVREAGKVVHFFKYK